MVTAAKGPVVYFVDDDLITVERVDRVAST
jgi:hypothetical protein